MKAGSLKGEEVIGHDVGEPQVAAQWLTAPTPHSLKILDGEIARITRDLDSLAMEEDRAAKEEEEALMEEAFSDEDDEKRSLIGLDPGELPGIRRLTKRRHDKKWLKTQQEAIDPTELCKAYLERTSQPPPPAYRPWNPFVEAVPAPSPPGWMSDDFENLNVPVEQALSFDPLYAEFSGKLLGSY